MYIQTPRLIIRDYQEEDIQDLFEIFSDPQVMRYSEPAYDIEKTQEALSFFLQKDCAYAVTLAQTGKVIGHALFSQLPPPEETGIYEIGWFFNRNFWRQGYAYEACKALIGYGFQERKLHKICAETIDPVRSPGLMQKLGMKQEGTFQWHTRDLDGNWTDLYWYGILSSEEDTGL